MWTYQQSTGELRDAQGNLTATGYAGGNCGKNPEGKNNPAMQDVAFVGPLPVGTYSFGTPENSAKLGPFAIPLIPDSSNDMFGRTDFFIHGDTIPAGDASEGCIVMPPVVRHLVWGSLDHQLQVIA